MDDPILKFLFDTSFADPEANLEGIFERLGEVEDMETKKAPLDKALAKIGIKDTLIDDQGVCISFDSSEAYSAARTELFKPDVIAELAELGWLTAWNGDTSPEVIDPPRYQIHFLMIDEAPGPDEKQLDQKGAEKEIERVAGHFVGDEGPVDTKPEKLKVESRFSEALTTFANEEVLVELPSGEALVQVDNSRKPGERMYVAVDADGLLTDYPVLDADRKTVRWDNPEYFSSEFRTAVQQFLAKPSHVESKNLRDLKAKTSTASGSDTIDAAFDLGKSHGRQARLNNEKNNPRTSLKGDKREAYMRGYKAGFGSVRENREVDDIPDDDLQAGADFLDAYPRQQDAMSKLLAGIAPEEAKRLENRVNGIWATTVTDEVPQLLRLFKEAGHPEVDEARIRQFIADMTGSDANSGESVDQIVDRFLSDGEPTTEATKKPTVDTPFKGSYADRSARLRAGDPAEKAEMARLAKAHAQEKDPLSRAVTLPGKLRYDPQRKDYVRAGESVRSMVDALLAEEDSYGRQKSDQTLTNDANYVVSQLKRVVNNGVSLADDIVAEADPVSALLDLFANEEDQALPGFHNLFSNMSEADTEIVAQKVVELLTRVETDDDEVVED